ncbi:molybdopterin converting factor subunit 1 [Paraherbaspirillum soli]|uniref:Molybdopterin synthase sulfur carrier subunit n=1 Tax=Paraherbaspirillum soli TaxID=631222 RepID=A0ABW0M7U8_9BURK
MKIQIRFFASVREALKLSEETVELPATVKTVGDLRCYLRARGGAWAEVLAEGRALLMALNQEMTSADTLLSHDCEVAFFPPVTGG